MVSKNSLSLNYKRYTIFQKKINDESTRTNNSFKANQTFF